MGLFFQTLKAVLLGTIADFLYTPIWWYTGGLLRQLKGVWQSFVSHQEALAIDVWLKNLFVPMYGQYDVAGRLISFFVRFAQIVGRFIMITIWAIILLMWLSIWILLPIALAYFIVFEVKSIV